MERALSFLAFSLGDAMRFDKRVFYVVYNGLWDQKDSLKT